MNNVIDLVTTSGYYNWLKIINLDNLLFCLHGKKTSLLYFSIFQINPDIFRKLISSYSHSYLDGPYLVHFLLPFHASLIISHLDTGICQLILKRVR